MRVVFIGARSGSPISVTVVANELPIIMSYIVFVRLQLLIHTFISLSFQTSESSPTNAREHFFPFGPETLELTRGDDQFANQDFPSPFLFYGKNYTSFGVSVEVILIVVMLMCIQH